MKTRYEAGVVRTLAHVMKSSTAGTALKPTILEFMITTRCDCHCRMCNIWRRSDEDDLSFSEITALLADPVLSDLRTVTLTGGEPFEREDIAAICGALAANAKDLLQIYISTNGYDTERIYAGVAAILDAVPDLPRLRIGISFDHMGERHDRIRGAKGLHANALRLIHRLRELDDPRLKIQGNVTISPYNIDHLREMHAYFGVMGLRVFWFPVMISSNFYENESQKDALAFTEEQNVRLKEFVRFLCRGDNSLPDQYYYTGLLQTLERGRRAFPCTGGRRFLHINATGDVYPCYVVPKDYTFGNVRRHSLSDLWSSGRAREVRRRRAACPTCASCIQWYDGFATSDDVGFLLKFLAVQPLRTFRKLVGRAVGS